MKQKVVGWMDRKAISKCLAILSKKDQKRVLLISLVQLFLSLFDLVGIALIGVLGALAIQGVESHKPGNRVHAVLQFLHISNLSFQTDIVILGLLAAGILIFRTLLSILITRRTLFFLSRRGAIISGELTSKLLNRNLLYMQKRSTQLTAFSLTSGVEIIVLKVIGTFITMVADFSILLVMLGGLLIVDSVVAISSFIFFGFIGLMLYKLMHKRARDLGRISSQLGVATNEAIVEVLNSYRESTVRNRKFFYSRKITALQMQAADYSAEMTFMPSISKYVIETSVVIGALLMAGLQFMLKDAVHAISTLSIFMAAGSRIAPASLRLQQSALTMKSGVGSAEPTLTLMDELGQDLPIETASDELRIDHKDFDSTIVLNEVSLTYPGSSTPAVSQVSLVIPPGSIVAFVGPSGAGKTSIVDLLLGVIEPSSGSVTISGEPPSIGIARWPGAISYVPQDIMTANGSIKENVTLGYPNSKDWDEFVQDAIRIANLEDVVKALPDGLDSPVGERGSKLSGGQRQRLGIARALFTKPKLLVLDEATSALDSETEAQITDSINKLRGQTTIILIAHRLSTVRYADIVVYMANGKMIASGTFEEVRKLVPDFDSQAKLMGI